MSGEKRPWRPAGSVGNMRETILAAARDLFATNGFQGTTMRAVASRAGADVALVAHYFRNKDGLFAATLQVPEEALEVMRQAVTAPLAERGEGLTRAYLGLWEARETRDQLRAVARAGLASQALGERMEGLLSSFLGAASDDESSAVRTATGVAMTQLLGIAVARHLLQVPTVVSLSLDDLVKLVTLGVQAVLDSAIHPSDPE